MHRVTESFVDWDGIMVFEGEEAELVIRDYSLRHKNHFWNLVRDGRVIAVTLGRPPVESVP